MKNPYLKVDIIGTDDTNKYTIDNICAIDSLEYANHVFLQREELNLNFTISTEDSQINRKLLYLIIMLHCFKHLSQTLLHCIIFNILQKCQ